MNDHQRSKKDLMAETARAWQAQTVMVEGSDLAAGDVVTLIFEGKSSGGIDSLFAEENEIFAEENESFSLDDAGIEWVILELESDQDASERALVVPADSRLEVGPGDLSVRVGEGEDLVLRCGFALHVDPEVLSRGERWGELDEEQRQVAIAMCRALEQGTFEADPEQLETGEETDYRNWLVKGPDRARRALRELADSRLLTFPTQQPDRETTVSSTKKPEHQRFLAWAAGWIIAVSLLAAGGLGWYVGQGSKPAPGIRPLIHPTEVVLRRVRGTTEIQLPAQSDSIAFSFDLFELNREQSYLLEAWSGEPPRRLWRQGGLDLRSGEEPLVVLVPRRLLPIGEVLLRLLLSGAEEEPPIAEFWIYLEHEQRELADEFEYEGIESDG